ncbi:MAG: hypothetical protein A3C53_02400 [Omnitrophica WOR_2 bacterium RIFCSPHIGHO2_02_FULL_68_15]|nr:MAG: hypothetical protein A3C53_02400 [Omnitrophica WOR_2 bacterium RIFCSPHIGHO2_02_FULL_68_15]
MVLQQNVDNIQVTFFRSEDKCGPAKIAFMVDVRSRLNQKFYHVSPSFLGGFNQWSLSILIGDIRIRLSAQCRTKNVNVSS